MKHLHKALALMKIGDRTGCWQLMDTFGRVSLDIMEVMEVMGRRCIIGLKDRMAEIQYLKNGIKGLIGFRNASIIIIGQIQ